MTASINLTQLYDILSQKFGKQEVQSIVQFIETRIESKVEEQTKGLATKEDIALVKGDIANVKADLLKEMSTNTRWMIGILFALAVMIIGLYFRK
jgi:hypothetical protein